MSRPFSKYMAKPTFANVNSIINASEYISKKKMKYKFCSPKLCHQNMNVKSYEDFHLLNSSLQPVINFNKSQLYANLYTKLDLNGNMPIITDFSGNYPVVITADNVSYNIDCSGILFGNTPCGLNNYLNYMVYNDLQ